MIPPTNLDLFAGIPVADYAAALLWYQRLLGEAPAFYPNDREAVWELAPHRYVYIVLRPEHAGHAMHLSFVDNLDARVSQIADRGHEPAERETYSNGVRKITYRDPDGNEIAFGGAPLELLKAVAAKGRGATFSPRSAFIEPESRSAQD